MPTRICVLTRITIPVQEKGSPVWESAGAVLKDPAAKFALSLLGGVLAYMTYIEKTSRDGLRQLEHKVDSGFGDIRREMSERMGQVDARLEVIRHEMAADRSAIRHEMAADREAASRDRAHIMEQLARLAPTPAATQGTAPD